MLTYVLFGQIFIEFLAQFANIFRTIAITSRIGAVVLSILETTVVHRWCRGRVVFMQFIIVVSIVAGTSPCAIALAQAGVFVIFAIVIADIVTSIVLDVIVVTLSKPI